MCLLLWILSNFIFLYSKLLIIIVAKVVMLPFSDDLATRHFSFIMMSPYYNIEEILVFVQMEKWKHRKVK